MTDSIEARLDELRTEVRALRELIEQHCAHPQQPTPAGSPDQLVGVEYVARLFGCSAHTVRDGGAGTSHVRWITRHPLRTTRSEAHAALRRWIERKERQRQRLVPPLVRRKRKH